MSQLIRQIRVSRYEKEKKEQISDSVVQEHVLSIRINENPFIELVCSPDQPENLAAGFLFTQGIVTDRGEIAEIVFDKEAFEVRITLGEKAADRLNTMDKAPKRRGSSGGLLFPESFVGRIPPTPDNLQISYGDVLRLIRLHHEKSGLFKQTGAVHSCAVCTTRNIIRFYEDIGRHNAFDKMAGDLLVNEFAATGKIVTASCRISLEILQKTRIAGFSVIISNAAPTYAAVRAAESAGITVIGFARNHRFNVYTHAGRIIVNDSMHASSD
ncbi:MAG: formate dehydrogenase accessory sulfurtransferase FdhD [Desulfarculaceae bacterium]|nr:formate dehydrogenase accessory sulfurtransferase FdhD [Desulfarculaceae bacterium]